LCLLLIKASNSFANPVLLAIPRLQVSVPGQEVISAVLSKPGEARPNFFNSSYSHI